MSRGVFLSVRRAAPSWAMGDGSIPTPALRALRTGRLIDIMTVRFHFHKARKGRLSPGGRERSSLNEKVSDVAVGLGRPAGALWPGLAGWGPNIVFMIVALFFASRVDKI